ncbi:MAG: DUF1553 domain-containing protein [Pirellulaceae bacterium]|nr:DUF1553 domain-containing protein [Pirellulaceae bacterium]
MQRTNVAAMLVLVTALTGITAAEDPGSPEFFEARIRPMLIKHCYECHSAESQELKGNLRVDSAAGLRRGGDSGPAVVPGKPEESPLLDALRYDGFEMPPAGRLPEAIVRDFEQWIKSGAVDPRPEAADNAPPKVQQTIDLEAGRRFWAFRPVVRHERPVVRDSDWPASDIDAFVLARLEAAGLAPAPDADRRTLIRRLYFDVVGLPPTPEEVRAFVEDESEGAIERVVDRLLGSREFGVHWGRHWLDVARYADSNGGDFNATFHDAWKYRDYVIRSVNEDKPFDQFVREQIAGDLLPAESDVQREEQLVATGFLMIGAKMLSERDKQKLTMDVVDEQVNTVGQAFLGLTLGCARCHDHKFDPIPTRDYYALAGIFRSTETLRGESQEYVSTWPRRALPAPREQVAALEAHEAAKKQLQAEIKQSRLRQDQLAKQVAALRAGERAVVVDNAQARLTGVWKASTFSPTFVGEGYIHDDQSEKGEKFAEFTLAVPATATYDVQLSYTVGGNRATNVPISIKHAEAEVEVQLNQRQQPPIDNLYASVGQFPFRQDQPAVVTIATRDTEGYVIVDAVRLVELDENGKPVIAEASEPSDEMKSAEEAQRQSAAELKQLEADLKQLEAAAPPPLPTAFAVTEAESIGDCEICVRGEHQNLGPKVPRGVLQVAASNDPPQFSPSESGRRELADWLASPDNPLTARVYVNRVWHHLLGRGIVASVDNFGQLGDRPTHPELLDRLAADFIRDGWSTRQLVRQIVLSRVYRLSSRHDEAAWNADPENRLLWRAHRRRLPAEAIRDGMLAISGRLDLSPGGSPVPGLGTLVTQNTSEQEKFAPAGSLRRSAYLPIIRAELPAILAVFDFADPDLVTGRRAVTNVPAQALLLLNSPFVMEQAEKAAAEVQRAASDPRQQVVAAYERVLSRPPTDDELLRAEQFLQAAANEVAAQNAAEGAGRQDRPEPLAQLIHTLFASTEFRMLN